MTEALAYMTTNADAWKHTQWVDQEDGPVQNKLDHIVINLIIIYWIADKNIDNIAVFFCIKLFLVPAKEISANTKKRKADEKTFLN